MQLNVVILCFLVLIFAACSGFQWTSSSQIADGSSIRACVGELVSFPWSFSLSSDEQIVSVEWHRTNDNGEAVLAVMAAGMFFPSQNVTSLPGAGLQVHLASLADFGTYSVRVNYKNNEVSHSSQQSVLLSLEDAPVLEDGQLKAYLVPRAVLDDVNGRLHVQVACGSFLSLGSRPVSVVWRTPAGEILESSDFANGTFFLDLPESAQGGGYYCFLKNPELAARCAPSMSRLQRGAFIHVDDVQIRLALLEGEMNVLKTNPASWPAFRSRFENLDRKAGQDADSDTAQEQDLVGKVEKLAKATEMLTEKVEKLVSDNERLVEDNEQLKNTTERLTSENEHLKSEMQSLRPKMMAASDQRSSVDTVADPLQSLMNQKAATPESERISFFAQMEQRDLRPGEILTSREVITNQGGAFNGTSGVFTAPVDGVYIFLVNMATSTYSDVKENRQVHLKIDGESKTRALSSNYMDMYITGSCHGLFHMSAGQQAWLWSESGDTQLWDEPTTFTGALLYADPPQ